MTSLVFYTTLGCHLCEDAEQLLEHLISANDVTYKAVDISSSKELVEKYGIRIPVVKNADSGDELGWPFDYYQLLALAKVDN
ncbi:MAG: glutaredoxin family protein [Pseudohongiellaceae bacterium]